MIHDCSSPIGGYVYPSTRLNVQALPIITRSTMDSFHQKYFEDMCDKTMAPPFIIQQPAVTATSMHFNPPYTTVIWSDGSKTIVKCTEGEEYDPEKGVALCYMKKVCWNRSKDFHFELKRAMKKWQDSVKIKKKKQAAKEKKKVKQAWDVVDRVGDKVLNVHDLAH